MHLIILLFTAASSTIGSYLHLGSFLFDHLSGWVYIKSITPRMLPNRLLLPRMEVVLPIPTEVQEMIESADSTDPNVHSWDFPLDPSPEAASQGPFQWPIEPRPVVMTADS